jgi:hypothetical protein
VRRPGRPGRAARRNPLKSRAARLLHGVGARMKRVGQRRGAGERPRGAVGSGGGHHVGADARLERSGRPGGPASEAGACPANHRPPLRSRPGRRGGGPLRAARPGPARAHHAAGFRVLGADGALGIVLAAAIIPLLVRLVRTACPSPRRPRWTCACWWWRWRPRRSPGSASIVSRRAETSSPDGAWGCLGSLEPLELPVGHRSTATLLLRMRDLVHLTPIISGLRASSGCRFFTAVLRPIPGCSARYTAPIPPVASSSEIRWFPTLAPTNISGGGSPSGACGMSSRAAARGPAFNSANGPGTKMLHAPATPRPDLRPSRVDGHESALPRSLAPPAPAPSVGRPGARGASAAARHRDPGAVRGEDGHRRSHRGPRRRPRRRTATTQKASLTAVRTPRRTETVAVPGSSHRTWPVVLAS